DEGAEAQAAGQPRHTVRGSGGPASANRSEGAGGRARAIEARTGGDERVCRGTEAKHPPRSAAIHPSIRCM
ncbi:MAG: hypothetical protein AVDCRST_MAG31-504, partial [uncultured Sphingomonas sp.]